jgi:hypothetical protein
VAIVLERPHAQPCLHYDKSSQVTSQVKVIFTAKAFNILVTLSARLCFTKNFPS